MKKERFLHQSCCGNPGIGDDQRTPGKVGGQELQTNTDSQRIPNSEESERIETGFNSLRMTGTKRQTGKAGGILNILMLMMATLVFSCNSQEKAGTYYKLHGLTQGTDYAVTFKHSDSAGIQQEIDELLHQFDLSLSTYIPNSIISRINDNDDSVQPDQLFLEVWEEAFRINELTDGAFDLTVGPLVDAWGFGPGRKLEMESEVIDSLMNLVGMDKISLVNGKVFKQHPGIRLDVNAIAQGYAVEVVADFLEEKGVENYMINIGGEIKCKGINPKGVTWRIGVDKPVYGNLVPGQQLQAVVNLENRALASSGNYRKYYEVDGKKIVHTVDPKTGYTRPSNLLSATIVTYDCMTADALATACMVKGLEGAKKLVASLDDVEAYFIFTDDEGLYYEWFTPGMEGILEH